MTTMQETIVKTIAEANKVAKAGERLNARREGIYTVFTRLAAENGQEAFAKATGDVFDAIRENLAGIAADTGCKPGKKEGTYLVPSAASSAKSWLEGSFEYGIHLIDEETDAPRPFTQIRNDVKAAKDAEAKAGQSDELHTRDALVAQLNAMVESLTASDEIDAVMADSMARFSVMIDAWADEHATLSGVEVEEQKAA
jgi:hypothetical protein